MKKSEELRNKAKAILARQKEVTHSELNKLGVDKMIEELSIYQVELEMQNESLLEKQEELIKSTDRFEGLFNHAPVGYLFLNEDLKIIECNNTFSSMIGISRSYLIGKNLSQYIHPDYQDTFYLSVNTLFKTQSCDPFELNFSVKNKPQLHVQVDGYHTQYTDGSDVVLLSVVDISERIKTEKLLQEKSEEIAAQNEELATQNEELAAQNEEYLTLNESLRDSMTKEVFLGDIIRNSSVAIAIGYPDGKLGLSNDAFQKLTGYNEKEIYEEIDWVKDLTPPEYLEPELEALEKLHKTKNAVVYEKEYIRKDGSRVPIELVVHPRLDPKGNIECYFAFITDITERKKAAETLLLEKERSQQYLDIAGVMMIALDKKGIVTLANKRATMVLGYEQDELLGKDWIKTFIPKKNQPQIRSVFKDIVSGKLKPHEKEEGAVLIKNGEERIIKWANRIVYDDKGKINGTLSSGEDVTEQRKAEADLKKIEWLLKPKLQKKKFKPPKYGDLTKLNAEQTILHAVGKKMLEEITQDLLDLLDTSVAVYERNGDYAMGIFASSWCQLLDSASRNLCGDCSNKEALESGKWLCHESCWTQTSKVCIQTKQSVDKPCAGGLNIYSVPIFAAGEVVGAINFGWGNPPNDVKKLTQLAKKYRIPLEKLKKAASNYETRPPFIIDIAKERLTVMAKLIGETVARANDRKKLVALTDFLNKTGDLARVGGWEVDLRKQTVSWTETTKRIHEVPLDYEPSLDEAIDFFPGISKKIISDAVSNAISLGVPYDLILDFKTRKGNKLKVRTIGNPVLKDGKCVKFSGIFQDITKEVKAQKEVIESEEKYRKLFDNINEAVALHEIILDKKGKPVDFYFLDCNPMYEKITQLKPADIIGKKGLDVIPNLEQKWIDLYGEVAITGKSKTIVDHSEYLDKYWEVRVYSPQKHQFAVAFTDVTETIQTRKALEESEARYRELFEGSRDGFVRVSLNGKILQCNPAFCSMLGYTQKELLDMDDFYVITPEKWQQWEKEEIWDKRLMVNHYSGVYEKEYIRKDGSIFPVELRSYAVVDEKGAIQYLWGLARDISEKKHIEQEIWQYQHDLEEKVRERTQQLEEKNQKLEKFNKLFIGREFRIKELRDKVKDLEQRLTQYENE
jgi:PAS domain S-box-containing protein